MKKNNILMNRLASMTIGMIPIITVVACSVDNNQPSNNPFEFPGDKPSASWNPAAATYSENAFKEVPQNWGVTANHEFATDGAMNQSRIDKGGKPFSPTRKSPDALWNWSPDHDVDGSMERFYGNRLDYLNPDGTEKMDSPSITVPTGTGNTTVSTPTRWPQLGGIWGDVDMNYHRATVPLKEKIYGEEINPFQSIFARYDAMMAAVGEGKEFGISAGKGKNGLASYAGWQYTNAYSSWGGSPMGNPSGDFIDIAHRNGVPVLGKMIFFHFEEDDFRLQVLLNPGPNKDYPVAKGMAEWAQFFGIDGWWIDWEHSNKWKGQDIKFTKALQSYMKLDKYVTEDGITVSLAEQNKVSREKYEYSFTEKFLGIYPFARGYIKEYGDISHTRQIHGYQDNSNDIQNWFDQKSTGAWAAPDIGRQRDRYYENIAINHTEDGFREGARGILARYANAQQGLVDDGHSEKNQNQLGAWTFSMEEDTPDAFQNVYTSFTGDVRATDNSTYLGTDVGADLGQTTQGGYWVYGNSFRETTPIIGRDTWSTTFDYGSGNGFNLWGGKDILKSVYGASSQDWKMHGMQAILPTYRWMMDFYNSAGTDITDLTLDPATHKLQNRPVQPLLNTSTKNAWLGGTTLDYVGALAPNNSFVNKLYASNLPVENGDEFTIRIRDNWEDETERIIPEFSVWEAEGKIENEKYLSNGTEDDPLAVDTKFKLGWSPKSDGGEDDPWNIMPEALKYRKDIMEDYKSDGKKITEKHIRHSEMVDEGDWLKLTYKLDDLSGNSITGFGIKATGNSYPKNIENLKLGQMSFVAHDDKTNNLEIEIANVNVDQTFTVGRKKSARISWDSSSLTDMELMRENVRNYFVFYKNEYGIRTGLAWIGANPAAFLDYISTDKVNIEIVAVGEDYRIIGSQDVSINLTNGGTK